MKVNGHNTNITHRNDPRSNLGQAKVFHESGRIILDAGAGNDRIDIKKLVDGRYHVGVNGQDFSFSRSEFASLTVRGGSGNDRISIDRSVDLPVRVEGGKGNDQISGTANRSMISGGSGHDWVSITGNDNYVRGNSGNDTLSTYGFRNTAFGDTGYDYVRRAVPDIQVPGRVLWSKVRG